MGYPYLDVSHGRAVRTLVAFRKLLQSGVGDMRIPEAQFAQVGQAGEVDQTGVHMSREVARSSRWRRTR